MGFASAISPGISRLPTIMTTFDFLLLCNVLTLHNARIANMSLGRLVPVALAVGFGVLNGEFLRVQTTANTYRSAGYVTFNPAFQDLEAEKIKKE